MQSVRFAAVLALLLLSGIEAKQLDFNPSNSGDMPEKMETYFKNINAEMDRSGTEYTIVGSTTLGTGNVFKGRAVGASRTTFVFTSKFEGLKEEELQYFETLYVADTFSKRLDPTYIEGAYNQWKVLSSEELGAGITGQLSSTIFKFIPGLPAFDRELVIVGAKTQLNSSCVVYGNPSVSTRWSFSTKFRGGWVGKNEEILGNGIRGDVEGNSSKVRAENIFPTGDRVCITTGTDGYNVQVDHMITTKIGGVIDPIYALGTFDSQQTDAYLSEAQTLENNITGRRLSSSHGRSLLLV